MLKVKFLSKLPVLACPLPAKDLKLNTKNRDAAIKADHIQYGPLNLSDGSYWEGLADHWKTDVEVAKKSLCGNCVAFDISPRMDDCMPGSVSDKEGRLGYCWMHHFKCHSARSCRTWATGGPIKDDKVSSEWASKSDLSEGKAYKNDKELAAMKPPKNKVTQADVLAARGITESVVHSTGGVLTARKDRYRFDVRDDKGEEISVGQMVKHLLDKIDKEDENVSLNDVFRYDHEMNLKRLKAAEASIGSVDGWDDDVFSMYGISPEKIIELYARVMKKKLDMEEEEYDPYGWDF